MDKRDFLLLAGITLGLSLLPAGCSDKNKKAVSEAPVVDVALPVVDSVMVYKTYPGSISANSDVKIVGRVNGYLTGKYYSDGELVKKGQHLFSIESTQYEDAVRQAQAQLETAIATNKYATSQYKAMKKALESDAVSQMDVIQAESAMNESLSAIENARAALRTARTNLSYCTITTPVTGHISTASMSVGDYVSGAGSPVVLTTVYEDNAMKALFSIEESQYIKIRDSKEMNFDNIPVSFTDSLPHKYSGRLYYFAPSVNLQTGGVNVRVSLDNPYGELKNGMYAEISLPDEFLEKAVMIKDASISSDQLGKYVYVVNDSDKVVYTPITVGAVVRDSMRIVKSGLKGNEKYVTKALLKVRDGMIVKPKQEK